MTEVPLDIPQLAASYRRLVLWFGVQLLLGVVQAMAVRIGGSFGADLYSFASLGVPVTIIAFAYHGYHTAKALGLGAPWFWGILMLVPFLNVVMLLWISSLSTKACKAAGVEVGLLGPKI